MNFDDECTDNIKKRKKANSSGSDSIDKENKTKQFKPAINSSGVSEHLNQSDNLPYDSCENLNTSSLDDTVFINSPSINNTNKMQSAEQLNDPNNMSSKLDTLITAVQELKTSQDGMKRMFESKLDKLRTDLMANVDNKIRALRDELSIDIGTETARVDQVLLTVQSMQDRINNLEQNPTPMNIDNTNDMNIQLQRNPLDNPELTITASGIPFSDTEDIMKKATDLISALGEEVRAAVRVVSASRLPSKIENKPGLVKISFRNTAEKVQVLRNKMKLKDTDDYKRVYIRSSKSRVERLIEMNARAVLRTLPQGQSLRVDASGRIITKNEQRVSKAGNGGDE